MPVSSGKAKEHTGYDTVEAEWMLFLPIKMQAVLMQVTRGPDSAWFPLTKLLTRYIRQTVQKRGEKPQNDVTDYMRWEGLPLFGQSAPDNFEREIEYWPVHFYHHMVNALAILAYRHPNEDIRQVFNYYYVGMVDMIHLEVEDPEHLAWRLEDNSGEQRDPPPPVPPELTVLIHTRGETTKEPPPKYRVSGY